MCMPGSLHGCQIGRSVLYSRGSVHSPSLWRVWVFPNGSEPRSPRRIPDAGVGVRSPAVSSNGRLAFAVRIFDADIWRVNLTERGHRHGSEHDTKVVVSTRLDHTVEFSPDGERLAFASQRSGAHEIWVSNADGKSAMQLTSFDGPYTASPHWSPDGHWISFRSDAGGNIAVYTIPAQGGAIKRLDGAAALGQRRIMDTGRTMDLLRDQRPIMEGAGDRRQPGADYPKRRGGASTIPRRAHHFLRQRRGGKRH